MKKLLWLIPFLALPAFATPQLVIEQHDKWPVAAHGHDNECNEQHNLKPDGDHDCDDPTTQGVSEPGTLALALLAAAGLVWTNRRRK